MKRDVPQRRTEPTPLLDALELGDRNCGICQESFSERDIEIGEVAEMYDQSLPFEVAQSMIVHAHCGLSRGWEIA